MTQKDLNRRYPWLPQEGPQLEAYVTPAFETLYGGQAGGGKTDLVLGLARCEHHRSLILRRSYADLERFLVERSKEFYGPADYYNASKHVWRVDGRRVEFGYLENIDDLQRYQGVPYDLVAPDELTQYDLVEYEGMLRSIRTTFPGQRCRIVATANPGGKGHVWVMRRWGPWLMPEHPRPAKPGEIRWFVKDAEGKEQEVPRGTPLAISRTFIRASLRDNAFLGAEYLTMLENLPEPMRSQLRDGNWMAGMDDDDYRFCPREWIRLALERWRMWDEAGRPGSNRLDILGCDVAERGTDESVEAPLYEIPAEYANREGWPTQAFGELAYSRGSDPTRTSGRIINRMRDEGDADTRAVIDSLGVGAGVYSNVMEEMTVVDGFRAGNATNERDLSGQMRFADLRTCGWWFYHEALDPQGETRLAIPPDDKLVQDLTAMTWGEVGGGKIRAVKKDLIRKLIGRSTDPGDATMMAVYAKRVAAGMGIF